MLEQRALFSQYRVTHHNRFRISLLDCHFSLWWLIKNRILMDLQKIASLWCHSAQVCLSLNRYERQYTRNTVLISKDWSYVSDPWKTQSFIVNFWYETSYDFTHKRLTRETNVRGRRTGKSLQTACNQSWTPFYTWRQWRCEHTVH